MFVHFERFEYYVFAVQDIIFLREMGINTIEGSGLVRLGNCSKTYETCMLATGRVKQFVKKTVKKIFCP